MSSPALSLPTRTEAQARADIQHPKPKAICFCMCCGIAIETGFLVQYAADAPPDIFCNRACYDNHTQELCECFAEVAP